MLLQATFFFVFVFFAGGAGGATPSPSFAEAVVDADAVVLSSMAALPRISLFLDNFKLNLS
jgi:hypothetical protein